MQCSGILSVALLPPRPTDLHVCLRVMDSPLPAGCQDGLSNRAHVLCDWQQPSVSVPQTPSVSGADL